MAGDIRDVSNLQNGRVNISEDVNKSPSAYEIFHTPPPQPSANPLPEGMGQNTAGAISRQPVPSFADGIKTVRWQDFWEVHKYPCARDAFLTGIGGGFGIGGIRAVFGAPVHIAANWAVGTFALASFASYEYCQYRRRLEKQFVKRAIEISNERKAEKDAQIAALEAKRKERRRLKEEEDRKEEAARRWWKF